jgi:hypothetical protein
MRKEREVWVDFSIVGLDADDQNISPQKVVSHLPVGLRNRRRRKEKDEHLFNGLERPDDVVGSGLRR